MPKIPARTGSKSYFLALGANGDPGRPQPSDNARRLESVVFYSRVKCFTLIELIVVIAIIAVLGSIVAPHAFRAIEKAKMSQMISDLKVLKTGLLTLYSDTGTIPSFSDYGSTHPPVKDTDLLRPIVLTASQGWDGPYIDKAPIIPFGGAASGDYRHEYHDACLTWLWAGAGYYWGWRWYGFTVAESLTLSQKLDSLIDGSDGQTSGKIRYTNGGTIIFLIYDVCG